MQRSFFHFRFNKLALAAALSCAGAAAFIPQSAHAADADQNDTAVKSDKSDAREEQTIVTGSHLRRVDVETASPVLRISADSIQAVGFSSVQDVLSDLPQNSGGSMDQQQVFGFTPSASGVNLRGAGLGRSLTLVNGKRVPHYPVPAGGTDNFVDTANMPLGAVDRIEILTSGASAIYGSDAMGGVINVILKDEFEGLELSVKSGDTTHGGRDLTNITLSAGASGEKSKVSFFLERDEQGELKASQRNNFSNLGSDLAFDGAFGAYSSYGVSIRDGFGQVVQSISSQECSSRGLQPTTTGGVANCGFDRSARRDLYPEMNRTSALANFSYQISDSVKAYSRFDYTFSDSFIQIEPMPVDEYTYYLGMDTDGNPDPGFITLSSDRSGSTARFDQATAFGGDFATLADGVYYPTRRMVEFGNRRTKSNTNNYTFLSGVKGEFGGDWHWDVDWLFSRTEYRDENYGYASADLYFSYLSSGTSGRSVFDVMTQDEVDGASYIPWKRADSSFTGFSGSLDGTLFSMPAGPVEVATGFESYREWFLNTSDTESLKGNILATGGSSGQGSRDFNAVYVESLFPLLSTLDLTLAGRYDDFSDFGNHTSPQVSLEYRPTKTMLFRALWADTFRAPDLQRVYGDPTVAFEQIADPHGCELQGGTVDPNSIIAACNGELYVDVLVGPNANLKPETGNNWNLGFVYNAGELDASIDYWGMTINDIVNELTAQDIATNWDTYESLITRKPNGEISGVDAVAQNLSKRETSGVDFTADYAMSLNDLGRLRLGVNGTYLMKYDSQFSKLDPTENVIQIDRVPKWRVQFTVGWDLSAFSTNLYINYLGKMNGTNNEDFSAEDLGHPTSIDDQIRMNLSSSYTMGGFQAQIGINNLTDKGPNPDYTDFQWPYYPQEYYNALGRNYYVTLKYKFE